jgi:cell division protein ZapE
MVKKLQKIFTSYCNSQQLEVNSNQIDVINKLEQYYQDNFQSFFSKLFSKKSSQKGFYLYGGRWCG